MVGNYALILLETQYILTPLPHSFDHAMLRCGSYNLNHIPVCRFLQCVIFWLLQSLFLHFLLCHVSFGQLIELWLSKPFLVWARAVHYVFFYSMLSARYSAVLPVYLFLDPVSVTFWSIGYRKIIINLFLITYNFKVNYSLHVQFK